MLLTIFSSATLAQELPVVWGIVGQDHDQKEPVSTNLVCKPEAVRAAGLLLLCIILSPAKEKDQAVDRFPTQSIVNPLPSEEGHGEIRTQDSSRLHRPETSPLGPGRLSPRTRGVSH